MLTGSLRRSMCGTMPSSVRKLTRYRDTVGGASSDTTNGDSSPAPSFRKSTFARELVTNVPIRSNRNTTADRCSTGLPDAGRSEEHTSELQSQSNLVCRLLLEKKKNTHE